MTSFQFVFRLEKITPSMACIYLIQKIFQVNLGLKLFILPSYYSHVRNFCHLIEGRDETMISVALGYVCHLVTMIAYFLHVPLRYPTVHAGSRSKIYDHFLSTIPDSDRELVIYKIALWFYH